uniref:Uncharacterized protein n=1 Tax=viral metagenome TaxID=1070528 RepID=A0A6M3JH08_9ZZZZ
MKKYQIGMTATIKLEVRLLGVLKNADSASVTIYNPLNTASASAVAMTRIDTGKYEYRFAITANSVPGIYKGVAYATVGSVNFGDLFSFEAVWI